MSNLTNSFFQNSPDMLCISDINGRLLETNRPWLNTMNWTREQNEGPIFDQFDVGAKVDATDAFLKARTSGQSCYFEGYVRAGDLIFRYLFWNVAFDRSTETFQLSAREKTDFQRHIESLGTSKQHFQAMFSSMREGVCVQDSGNRVVHFNDAALEILGVTADQLLGRTTYSAEWKLTDIHGNSMNPENTASAQAMKTGQPQIGHQLCVHHADGQSRWISVNAIPVFRANEPTPYQIVITFHDITQQKNAISALSKKESELAGVIDSVPTLISYWNSDQINVFSNQAYASAKGLTPNQVKGKHLSEVMSPALYASISKQAHDALAGLSTSMEVSMAFGGGFRPVMTNFVPHRQDGKVLGFISIVTDISNLRRLEQDRREFESKMITASKMSSLGEMAAGVAHEINNPLAIINGKTMLLQERIARGLFDAEKFQKDLKSISSTVDRIAKTVRGLLAFSRNAEAEGMKSTSLRQVVEGTLDLCQEKMRARGVELRLDIDSGAEADCRSNQISQIVMNLLNNSFDAIDGLVTQWIHVGVTSNETTVQIRVTDSGRPIPSDIAEKIMNPFFTTKELGKGTGLGLSISKGLAESHGGTLQYDKASKNTSFVLEIPIRSSTDDTKRKVG